MAGPRHKGRIWRSLFMLLTAGLMITVLITTHVVNPGPWWNNFVHNLTRLSDPDPQWTVRIDGKPDVTGVLPNSKMVVVASRGFVEGYQTSDGKRVWHKAANWAYPAVDVVVSQMRPENPDANPTPDHGFAVLDPATGNVQWSDAEATAVWIYQSDIVDLTCPDSSHCVLRDRYHTGTVRWELELPGSAHTIRGPNPHLAGVRDPAGWFGAAAVGTAPVMPPIMPLQYDDKIHVVDTAEHKVVREAVAPDRQTRIAFLGDRMLFVRADRGDAGCKFEVEAFDIASGASVWHEDGFDLDTARGAGCEQREDPLGAGGRLVVNGTDARPMLVAADNAARIWTGSPGAKVLAADSNLAVVVAPDRQTVSIIDAATADGRTVWSGQFGMDPEAAITSDLVIIRDSNRGKLLVLARLSTQTALEVKTTSDVAGFGRNGIVLTSVRSIGYLSVNGV